MSFIEALQKETNYTTTENGAVTHKSTLSPLLDFFSLAGAMRDDKTAAHRLFTKAYSVDKQMAIRILFYLRDIRGGQGERDLFRFIMQSLAKEDRKTLEKIISYIPEYGRWDDLVGLYDYIPHMVGSLIREQLAHDEKSMKSDFSISLLAKWLPSENSSSKRSRNLARKLAEFLELSPSQYRRKIVVLRQYIKLLEHKMSSRQWGDIQYDKLPSQALRKHVKAFHRHDDENFRAYLEEATQGTRKMNTSTLYTYEVFDEIKKGHHDAANAMWANLPDYTNGTNALVVADVSGSMDGRPMSVSVSLALYFAERNTGPFNGFFMTFSREPQLVKISGSTLAQKMHNIETSEWDMNTNLTAVFNVLLTAAKKSQATENDLPRVIYIISDMEFDIATRHPGKTIFQNAQKSFAAAGYRLPHIVFWNVNARQTQAPATKFDNRVTLISGLSQSTFRYAVEGKSPTESMLDVINSERYAQITI